MHKIKQPLINCRGQCCQSFHYLTTKSTLKYWNSNAKKLESQHISIRYSRISTRIRFSLTLPCLVSVCHNNAQCAVVKSEICVLGNKLAQCGSIKIGCDIFPSKARVFPVCIKNKSLGAVSHSKINELTSNLLFVNTHINAIALLGSPTCW